MCRSSHHLLLQADQTPALDAQGRLPGDPVDQTRSAVPTEETLEPVTREGLARVDAGRGIVRSNSRVATDIITITAWEFGIRDLE